MNMNNRYDMDYDGMGNQGRFPNTREKSYKSAAKGAFVGWIGILITVIFALLFSGCYGTYYISDAEYSDLREEHAVTTFHNNTIYWGFNNGYYYYYGKPHYYPWYYYYNTCPPSYYHTTTHIVISKPVNKPTHRPKPTYNKPRGNDNNRIYIKPNRNHNTKHNTNKKVIKPRTKRN